MSNQLKKKFLGSDSVDGSKIKFSNDDAFRARNALDTADISLFKLNTSNEFQLLVLPKYNNSNVATESYVDTQVGLVADDVSHLVTLSGVAVDSDTLGNFGGSTIQDGRDIKEALQDLETAHEEVDQNVNDLVTLSGVAENAVNLGAFSGSTILNDRKVKEALQDLESAHEAHLNDTEDAHDASAISYLNNTSLIGATTVQAALDNIEGRVDALEVGGGDTKQVKISANDTTEGYLEQKVVGAANKIVISTLNDGGNEDLQIDIGSHVFDKSVDDTDDITEGSSKLFFTDTRARTAAVADSITDGVTNIAPSQNAVHDALALKVNKAGDTMSGFLTLHADPSLDLHAATKRYVDAVAEGLHVHAPAKAVLNDPLSGSVTYDNGTSGVGATLTLGTALTSIDGYTLQDQDRIIINGQANQAHNGIYVYQTGGTELIRASDFDTVVETAGGDFIFVQEGTTYGNSGWVMTETTSSIGSSPIVFVQFSGAGQLLEGDAIDLQGNEINVKYDNVGINLNGFNQLQLKDSGVVAEKIGPQAVTAAKIASDVAGPGLTQDGSGALQVNVDINTLEVVSDAVGIKDSGVSELKIANNAVTTNKIANGAVTAIKIASDVAGDGLGQEAGGALKVNVDPNTLEISADAVQIKDSGVTELKIANNAVTTNKIANDSVTAVKIASDVAGEGLGQEAGGALKVNVDPNTLEISADAVQIKDSGVTELKIANNAVTTNKIANDAVTAVKIASDVAGDGLGQDANGALKVNVDPNTLEISADTVQIKDSGVSELKIANSAVTTNKIANDAVTAAKIASDVAGDGLDQDGATGALKVKVDGVSIEVSADTVQIADNGVTSSKIAADAVTAVKLASDVAGIGLQQDGDSSLAVKLDGTSLSKSASGIKLNIESKKEAYTIQLADTVLASNYYDLDFVAEPKSIVAFVDRVGIHEGESDGLGGFTEDYIVSLTGGVGGVTRVTFVNALVTAGQQKLAAGDKLYFTYQKKIS
jgi:hypothetical protein